MQCITFLQISRVDEHERARERAYKRREMKMNHLFLSVEMAALNEHRGAERAAGGRGERFHEF